MENICANMEANGLNTQNFLQEWRKIVPDGELYPLGGWHSLNLPQARLQVFVGDVLDMLPDMPAKVDAWFMDGFSPAKNPAMWQPAVYNAMAQQSNPEATLATFTAAGHVRRGLEEAGFQVRKEKGFGHKRDMTVGRLCDKLKA